MRDVARRLIARWVPPGQSRAGRLIRWPLRVIPSHWTVRIVTGPNRGLRWVVGASSHGCWIGNYERVVADQLWAVLSPGDVFYDLGANVGYYTLLGSRAVGAGGQVISFEPLPRNLRFLKEHVALNELPNVRIVEAAVVEEEGTVSLSSSAGPSQANVQRSGPITVRGIKLDSTQLPPPDVVKMDVEGAEARVIEGGMNTLKVHRPVIVFSTHGEELERTCYSMLQALGYRVAPLVTNRSDHLAEPQ